MCMSKHQIRERRRTRVLWWSDPAQNPSRHLRPQDQTNHSDFDAAFNCPKEERCIRVAAVCGRIVSSVTICVQGQPRSAHTVARTFRYRPYHFWTPSLEIKLGQMSLVARFRRQSHCLR
jgi:hypothetical protein